MTGIAMHLFGLAVLALVALAIGSAYISDKADKQDTTPEAPDESAPQTSVEPAPVKEQAAVNDNDPTLEVAVAKAV